MRRALKHQRTVNACRFSLEPLEPRQLLAVAPSAVYDGINALPAAIVPTFTPQPPPSAIQSVITTVPSDGAQLTQSPDSLVVSFDQEVDFLWVDGNVMLDRVNSDG